MICCNISDILILSLLDVIYIFSLPFFTQSHRFVIWIGGYFKSSLSKKKQQEPILIFTGTDWLIKMCQSAAYSLLWWGSHILWMATPPICLLSSFYLHWHEGTNDCVPLIDDNIQSDCLIKFFHQKGKYIWLLAINKGQGIAW